MLVKAVVLSYHLHGLSLRSSSRAHRSNLVEFPMARGFSIRLPPSKITIRTLPTDLDQQSRVLHVEERLDSAYKWNGVF